MKFWGTSAVAFCLLADIFVGQHLFTKYRLGCTVTKTNNVTVMQRCIQESFLRPQIRQITHPHLVRGRDLQIFHQVPKHRQTMPTIGRFRPAPLPFHQQPLRPQQRKKSIPPQAHAGGRQWRPPSRGGRRRSTCTRATTSSASICRRCRWCRRA